MAKKKNKRNGTTGKVMGIQRKDGEPLTVWTHETARAYNRSQKGPDFGFTQTPGLMQMPGVIGGHKKRGDTNFTRVTKGRDIPLPPTPDMHTKAMQGKKTASKKNPKPGPYEY
jgi:hypothetical protein